MCKACGDANSVIASRMNLPSVPFGSYLVYPLPAPLDRSLAYQ